ncbi:MAG: hypothetical protein ACUVWX_13715 [Kiritimatiellia bacterium]
MNVAAELFPNIEIIDARAHLGRWGYPGFRGDLDDFRRLLDIAGFSKVIVSSVQAICYDVPAGNAEVAAAAESDERIYGSLVFNAHFPFEAQEQIAKYASHPRFVAVKIHPGVYWPCSKQSTEPTHYRTGCRTRITAYFSCLGW